MFSQEQPRFLEIGQPFSIRSGKQSSRQLICNMHLIIILISCQEGNIVYQERRNYESANRPK